MFKKKEKVRNFKQPVPKEKKGKLLNVEIVDWIILIKTLNAQRKVKHVRRKIILQVCAKKRQTRSGTVHNVESSDESSDNETESYLFELLV